MWTTARALKLLSLLSITDSISLLRQNHRTTRDLVFSLVAIMNFHSFITNVEVVSGSHHLRTIRQVPTLVAMKQGWSARAKTSDKYLPI